MFRRGLGKRTVARVWAIATSAALVSANTLMVVPSKVVYAETTEAADEESSKEASSEVSAGAFEEASVDASVEAGSVSSGEAASELSSVEETKNESSSEGTSQENDAASTLSNVGSVEENNAGKVAAVSVAATAAVSAGAVSASTESSSNASDSGSEASSIEASAAASSSSFESDEEDDTDEEESSERSFDDSKIDVWDFGAENLGEVYNNRLDVDTINGFYSVEAGLTGVKLATFSVDNGDFVFNDGGYSDTHRLRSTNAALTRFDDKSLKDENGNIYSGYLYSNKKSTDEVYVAIECRSDDIITAYVASNGTDSEVHFKNMEDDNDDTSLLHTNGGSTVTKMVFYPSETEQYKIYSATEKLVVARVIREHAEYAYLTGTVEGFKGTGSFDLLFTNEKNGNVERATVADGKYTVQLAEGFDYKISLEGADEYVITSADTVNISGDEEKNMTLEGISLAKISGKIKGIASDKVEAFIKAAEFVFSPNDEKSVYVPQIVLNQDGEGINFEVMLQNDVTYALSVADKEDTTTESYAVVEDYNLITQEIIVSGDHTDVSIEFEAKPTYKVKIVPDGATKDDLSEAVFTFTRLDVENGFKADGYIYEFTGTEGITLRDGQYNVEVSNTGAFVQKLTSNLIVNGSDVSKEISFSSEITEWDFSDSAFASKFADATSGNYNGLSWTNGRAHNNNYLYSGAGTISVPVKGDCQIQVTANYQYSYYFENESESSVNVKTGSTSQNDTFTYDYKGSAGTFDITVLGTSYITKIVTVYQTEYKSEILVGSSETADYETIGEALEAIRQMERADEQRVTVSIEPGNYEEMLVVDVPNVTFKNASQNPTNTLINSGVDIDDNAVRITWYYGHGYTYYSMGSDYKYDADILDANKANGYASVVNPGSGTGTYWNASVVISASGFEAENIIFENSFNQYMSAKAADDIIVAQSSAKEGTVARASMEVGDTTVQDKKYVERAAALALTSSAKDAYFEGCRIVGRQDTLYGAEGAISAFYDCAVYGGTDYIFGGMTAVFAKCDLVLNTSEDKNDVAYITAAQQSSSNTRGYLMYNCTVTSTEPGVDTASRYSSKPGQFGRPWKSNTSEVVFYNTVVDATKWSCGADGKYNYDESANTSLIQPAGWNTSLGGESARCVEYGTFEKSGENNSANRVTWALQPETAICADGTAISVAAFLGEWDPFGAHNNDMSIVFPDGTSQEAPVAEETPNSASATTVYTFESSDLTAFAAGAKADGATEKAGTDDYFTVIYSAKSKVDSSSKTWEDGYTSPQRVNFGGKVSTEKNAVKFTTSSDGAQVEVWWVQGGDDSRQMAIIDGNGDVVAITSGTYTKNSPYYSKLVLEKAGTYYLGGATNNNNIYKVVVTDGAPEEIVRAEWSSVNAPSIESAVLDENDSNKINVKVNALIGAKGGDKLVVSMYDKEDVLKTSQSSTAEKDSFDFSFAPETSGQYYFVATLSREDEEAVRTSSKSNAFDFVLPLTAPQFKNAVNKGNGKVKVKFYSVKEATEYVLNALDTENESIVKASYTPNEVVENTSTEYEYTFVGLNVGHTYKLVLSAKRGDDVSKESTMEVEITQDGEQEWTFATFGQGVSTSTNKATVHDDGSITVASTGGKGKLVPASTDGLAFYYATIPANKNFRLSATVKVDSWKWSNGQEGFGLMAADAVGVNGDASAFWNNSYMATATKVEYYYDPALGTVTDDTTASKITMKIGLGSQQKIGVTQDNIELFDSNDSETIKNEFSSTMKPLETSCGEKGAGTYNLIGNETSGGVSSTTVENPITELKLSIQKNNTGYFVSYTDASGNTTTHKYYDTKALENIDSENVYAGFFASRNATATFSDIELTLVNPEDDAAAEEKPVTYITPSYKIISAEHSNTAKYVLQYTGNADGLLTIKDNAGNKLVDGQSVQANTVVNVDTELTKGSNTFTVVFVPDKDFHPENDEYQLLSSYESATFDHTVDYQTISNAKEIYVSPEGTSAGKGTENDPVDIYTAVKYVQPGQTIKLAGGTYSLDKTVVVARGIDGTKANPIKMVADSENRAVFDFNKACAGFIFAGDYWYVSGIDCTKSANAQKGIQLSGSYCTLEDIRTYENGNTGIQVSRYLSSDDREEWPSNDLILNCTSFSNADSGYEDADGFAAKLTCGEGIVFDGCISYNNADDGWDLYAKPETGSIGQVTIQNCVAFANGYGVDGTDEGNGNGFKMGGSSISGAHKLINSIAWGNKAKGIDSNSGPDIQVYHSMSFNNGSNNVALYTNDAQNTDYYVNGVLSYRTTGESTNENIKNKGTQDSSKIYGNLNFFWKDGKSANSDGVTASDKWFVSLEAPYANASDPYKVAESIRSSNGKIDLGDFLKISDAGIAELSAAGIAYTDVVAILNGSYEAGSGNVKPGEEDEPANSSSAEAGSSASSTEESSSIASSASTEESSSSASTASTEESSSSASTTSTEENSSSASSTSTEASSSSTSQASTEAGSTSSSQSNEEPGTSNSTENTTGGEASTGSSASSETGSDTASEGSGSSNDEESGSSESAGESQSVPATKVEPVPVKQVIENIVNKVVSKVTNFVNHITENNHNDDEKQVAGAERDEDSQNTEEASNANDTTEVTETPEASGNNDGQAQTEIQEGQSSASAVPSNGDSAKENSPIPVAPIAATGATVVVVAAAAVAVKTGLMAKILAILHFIK